MNATALVALTAAASRRKLASLGGAIIAASYAYARKSTDPNVSDEEAAR